MNNLPNHVRRRQRIRARRRWIRNAKEVGTALLAGAILLNCLGNLAEKHGRHRHSGDALTSVETPFVGTHP